MRASWASRHATIGTAALVAAFAGLSFFTAGEPTLTSAQSRIDFAKDVQPLLKERCYECHGPTKQMNGYRLDKKSRAMAGVVRPNIIPGSSESSRVYRRVLNAEFGPKMPMEDDLTAEEIAILKRWIDEGAQWPDALANETPLPPEDPSATRIADVIRSSRRAAALQNIRKDPTVVNKRGPGGSTPLMYAVLYGDAAMVATMLKAGADPNIRNHTGATALTWSVDDVEKVKLLIDAGADVNTTSDSDARR